MSSTCSLHFAPEKDETSFSTQTVKAANHRFLTRDPGAVLEVFGGIETLQNGCWLVQGK